MSAMGGLGGVLARLEGMLLESVDAEPRIGRYRLPVDWVAHEAIERSLSGLLCRSIDMTTGRKICVAADETDFLLPGRLPIAWARFYSSALTHAGLLGAGWRTGWEVSLRREGERLVYLDEQGRPLSVPMPRRGAQIIVSSEQLHVAHLADGRFVVADLTPHYRVFGSFDETGVARLKYVEDARGQRIGCIWDASGRLLRMRGTCGHELRMHYLRGGLRVSGIECVDGGPPGWLVRYSYDESGHLAEVRNRAGDVARRFAYENGRMVEETGSLGQTTRYAWQVVGGAPRVVERTTCRGARERLTYKIDEHVSEAADVFGHTSSWRYDARGQVREHVDFDGRRRVFVFDGAGWPTGVSLPGGKQIRADFDDLGRMTREIDPLGGERSTVYAYATREPVTVRCSDGRLWVWRYDDRLRPVQYQAPSTGIVRIAYAERDGGETRTDTFEHGATAVVEYDRRGCVVTQIDAMGGTTAYRRDARGHVVERVNALGETTKIEPDGFGRPLIVTWPDGRQARHVWNAAGQLSASTGPDGRPRYWHRDRYGCVVRAIDEEGHATAHEYDAHGRRIRTISGNGATQSFAWDPVGRPESIIDADGVTREFRYAASGDVSRIVTTAGSASRDEIFSHDPLGRLIGRDTEHARHRYAYTSGGRLETASREPTDAGRAIGIEPDTIRFEYDRSGRVAAEHGTLGALRYERDAAGRTSAVIAPGGQAVRMEHDAAGRVVLTGMSDGDAIRGIAAFRHDALGKLILHSQGELYLRSDYTPAALLESRVALTVTRMPDGEMQAGDIERWRDFQYSAAGHLVQVNDRFDGRAYYDYDRRGCLLRAVSDELGIEYFTWDAAGNLLEMPRLGWEVRIYPDHRVRECRGHRYEYDALGQVIGKEGASDRLSLTWDADGRLVEVRGRHARARFRYDALGRRIGKSVEWSQARASNSAPVGEVTHFVWQGERLLQESTAEAVRTYLYQPDGAERTGHAPLACIDQKRNEDGTLQPMRVHYYHTDAVGTAVALTDETGAQAWSGRYKAWGRLVRSTGMSVPIRQPLRFAGHYEDDETGLHLNGSRYYDPDAGRYLSPDRTAPAGTSPYRYVSSPLTECNPAGRAVSPASPLGLADGVALIDRFVDAPQRLAGVVEELDRVMPGPAFQLADE
ncbi:hypothetical protein WJ96_20155 [Burkholderia ubonensis]|uniref:Type IV secretion protein Rhs n=1 Tax=Burkholderia ubonensis TaxID=101571 RepID=A0AAW3MTT4_9BURK|nr:RHS repeat-associated core domain-containing protein [Burkholderia ubonensis]KVP89320.1 hypothetical protein WJ96_20155 [Burkholderia ubonensis]KWD49547.1 hypothetical protein WL66_20385 [Burkholderia ubonensis]KWD67976.1 hypothetical protein WL67_28530 [Burkholderia ubonensis]